LSLSMQSKVVDARLEITEGRVLPLRVQRESFAYKADLDVLQQYYDELWRAYVFVAPELFRDAAKCKAIVDEFCEHFGILPALAYGKVRVHEFTLVEGVTVAKAFDAVNVFLAGLPFPQITPGMAAKLLGEASSDTAFLSGLQSSSDVAERLTALLHIAVLKNVLSENQGTKRFKKPQVAVIDDYMRSLTMGGKPIQVAARSGGPDMSDFVEGLLSAILGSSRGKAE
jgi:hypothetical protein